MEVDTEFLEGLGQDPLADKAEEVVIHSMLKDRWRYYIDNGLKAEEKEESLLRNKRPSSFEPPLLNPWFIPTSDPNAETKKRRDKYLLER